MKWFLCVSVMVGMVWGDTLLFKDDGKVNNFEKHAKMNVPLIENAPWWDKDSWQQWDEPMQKEKEKPIRLKKPVVNMPLLENAPWWDKEQWQDWSKSDSMPKPQSAMPKKQDKTAMADTKKPEPTGEVYQQPVMKQWKESKN